MRSTQNVESIVWSLQTSPVTFSQSQVIFGKRQPTMFERSVSFLKRHTMEPVNPGSSKINQSSNYGARMLDAAGVARAA